MQHSSRAEPILFLPFLDLHAHRPQHSGASAIAQRDTSSTHKVIAAHIKSSQRRSPRVQLPAIRSPRGSSADGVIAKDSHVPARPAPLPPSARRSCGLRDRQQPQHGRSSARAQPAAPRASAPRSGVPLCGAAKVPPPSQKNFPPWATRCDAAPRPPPRRAEREGPAPYRRSAPRPGGPGCPPWRQGGCGAGPPEPMAAVRRAGCGGRRRADNRGGVGSGAGGEPRESRAAPCGGRKVSPAAPGKGISSLVL